MFRLFKPLFQESKAFPLVEIVSAKDPWQMVASTKTRQVGRQEQLEQLHGGADVSANVCK
ncbi:hypothetical protein Pyn_38593 [Prunus yedoensis var. nudiflora]|uniref:Uncharacterized protein n=1 Tax=Prunus yedoensis var. nudiflora TaxID=2094558 RepID=A0A314XMT1_PRUYE|nr:hypothetical protein Pyn_38593 [Prunus yedoensis var. nudiflora]